MDYLPLITIPAIYFLVAFSKPVWQRKVKFKICAICIAVSFTWLLLLLLWLLKFPVPPLTIGVLIGMSITGIMYKAENLYQRESIKNFWLVRLVMIVGGFYSVYFLLEEDWESFVFAALVSFFASFIVTFLFQGTTHQDVVAEQKGKGFKAGIIKKLDNCC